MAYASSLVPFLAMSNTRGGSRPDTVTGAHLVVGSCLICMLVSSSALALTRVYDGERNSLQEHERWTRLPGHGGRLLLAGLESGVVNDPQREDWRRPSGDNENSLSQRNPCHRLHLIGNAGQDPRRRSLQVLGHGAKWARPDARRQSPQGRRLRLRQKKCHHPIHELDRNPVSRAMDWPSQ